MPTYIATAMYIYPTDNCEDAADSGDSVDLLLILTIAPRRTGVCLERFQMQHLQQVLFYAHLYVDILSSWYCWIR